MPSRRCRRSSFKQDEPSGACTNLNSITVDGATGAAFYGADVASKVQRWFVHGRYLYEVTTLKPLDAWLASIMHTWNSTDPNWGEKRQWSAGVVFMSPCLLHYCL